MDALEKAMQKTNFILVDNKDNPKIILYGKVRVYSKYDKNEKGCLGKSRYTIGESWANRKDFSMHYIHSYDGVKEWLNTHTAFGYEYYLDLYMERTNSN